MGRMLIALRRTSDLSNAGHWPTHTPHPVQSSGATWIVSSSPGFSRLRKPLEGWSAWSGFSAGSKTLIRIAACGQTIVHLPQSMQRSDSQIGILVAIVRFS